jgi:xanthine dehydrogenase accessory factor
VIATPLDGESAALVLTETGARHGTLGDSTVNERAASIAGEVMIGGSRIAPIEHGGASRQYFFDRQSPPTTVVIVGAGQIAMSLTRMARELDMRTIVVDGRERYATRERFPDADEIRVGMPSEIVASIAPSKRVAVVLIAHDYKYELPVLRALLRSSVGYIGMLGSRKRGDAVRALLLEEGFTEAELARIHTPIGLDIGGKSPPEVAISILGELVAVRSGKRA